MGVGLLWGMASPGPSKKGNLDRFIYYFAGVAIGCVMVGMIMQARKAGAGKGGGLAEPPPGAVQPEKPPVKPEADKTSDLGPKPQTTP